MMRRSGVSPAVKRSKLSGEMLRRAASGHIEATQLSKFAAASRIADAVISGGPGAPSPPLQGGAAPVPAGGALSACGEVPGGWPDGALWLPLESEPVKRLSRKPSGPPPLDDCACAWPSTSNAAAMAAAPVLSFAKYPVRRVMSH